MNAVAVCRSQGENQGNVNIIFFVMYSTYHNKSDEIIFPPFQFSLQGHHRGHSIARNTYLYRIRRNRNNFILSASENKIKEKKSRFV